MMYNPPKFMSLDLVAKIVAEFEWPVSYTLEDDLPDCIAMCFPKCELCFSEGFESNMDIFFPIEYTQTAYNLRLVHALQVLKPQVEQAGQSPLPLIDDFSPQASLEKVENGLRDLCLLSLSYLETCILGDFSWARQYTKG